MENDDMEETAPNASCSLRHTVRMSSLLSDDVEISQDAPHPPRSGLSSLINSPLLDDQDDEIVLSQEPEAVENEIDDNVEMEEKQQSMSKMLKLQTTELQRLQTELDAALLKFYTETAPAPKRQKKGKQNRRTKAAAVTNSNATEMEIFRVLGFLQRIVSTQFAKKDVLEDVVKLCLAFLEQVDEKEPMQSFVVLKIDKKKMNVVDLDKTVGKLPSKPLYRQVTGVLRRTVLCGGEVVGKELLTQVLNWCLARPTPSNWMWMLVSIAQMNSYFVQEFLFREAIARYQGIRASDDEVQHFLPTLEFLIEKYPAKMVDILCNVLEECASSSEGSAETVRRLLALASNSAVLVAACDNNLQWIVTDKLVNELASKFEKEKEANSNDNMHLEGMKVQLLDFVRKRSAELSNSGFQLLLLLQTLSASDLPPHLAASVASFQKQLREVAVSESSRAFAKGIYRFLPYICQSTLQLLQAMTSADETSDCSMTSSGVDEVMSRETASRCFEEWKQWLYVLAQSSFQKEVTDLLIKTDLMSAELNNFPLTTTQPADRALCELLTSLLTHASPEYVNFVRNLMHECQSAAPRAQRRILGIVRILLSFNDANDTFAVNSAVSVNLLTQQDASCMQQLARAESWSETLDSFVLWKGFCGVAFWEIFLDLARSKDSLVASRALSLVSQTPFLSLEDPAWQYRCVQKLSGVFFSTLRQYRSELVWEGEHTSSELRLPHGHNVLQNRLQTLKMIVSRVLTLDGGVAHYQSSIYSMFASVWLDALLSNTSVTSIPTHFPNRVNFADLINNDDGLLDERQIIRCERTFSSKCTNLQSSQVITKVPEAKLVYRKTLDSSWEREMHAARVCSVYATDLFSQLLASTGTAASLVTYAESKDKILSNAEEDEQFERRLKTVVDMLLERVVPCCGIPNDDVYKDLLPNRSSFDVDLRVEQWLNHFPAFLPLLRSVVSTSTVLGSLQLLRLVPVFKSALIVLLGHWNSVKGELSVENVDVPPYMRNQNQLAITCELMRLLRATTWLPVPLSKTAELLPLTTPADIRSILFSCWFYLSDHPPKTGSRAPTPATSATTSPISSGSSPAGRFSIAGLAAGGLTLSSSHPPLEFYLIPLRKALHRNIHKIGAKYPLFAC